VQALRVGIAVAVTIIWTATYGRYVVVGGDAPPPELSGIMLAVVTAVLGNELRDVIRQRRNGRDE
jgi:hypothetical protein